VQNALRVDMYPVKGYFLIGAAMSTRTVELSLRVKQDLRRAPHFVVHKLLTWVQSVQLLGIDAVRRVPGYHDEPLRGKRQGHRSFRLNRAWRGIYVEVQLNGKSLILVEEVTKHDY
jgi:toxin HigB-1